MAWFKIDDQFAFHPKVLAAGAAIGSWVRMGAWSAAHLTDGKLPRALGLTIAGEAHLAILVASGLLDQDGENFAIHDFLAYNPSRAEAEERRRVERANKSAAGSKGAKTRWQRDGRVIAGAMAGAMPPAIPSATPVAITVLMAPSPSPSPSPDPKPDPSGSGGVGVSRIYPVGAKTAGFLAAWKLWSKWQPANEQDAAAAWQEAIREDFGGDATGLVASVKAWLAAFGLATTPLEKRPHFATWLGKKRWAEKPPETTGGTRYTRHADGRMWNEETGYPVGPLREPPITAEEQAKIDAMNKERRRERAAALTGTPKEKSNGQ